MLGGEYWVGILLGVGFFMLNQLALNVGMLGKWPPWLTALGPNIGAMALALGVDPVLDPQALPGLMRKVWALAS